MLGKLWHSEGIVCQIEAHKRELRIKSQRRRNLQSQRHVIVRKLFPLIGQWEADVDAEAKALAIAAPSSPGQ